MILTSWPSKSITRHSLKLFKNAKMSLILLCLLILSALPTEAADKARLVLTGDEVTAYKELVKLKGESYGLGMTPEGWTKLIWIFAANAVAWLFLMSTKIWETWKGDKREIKKASAESREAWLKVASDIAYMKENMATKVEVTKMIREEVKYLRENKAKF
jgi:hypothetical protein